MTMKAHQMILATAILAFSGDVSLAARTVHRSAVKAQGSHAAASGYYVEFLARPSQYFGHSYVQVGRIDRAATARTTATVGFYPKSVKSVFDAPGTVTATPSDLRATPSVRYRVAVSERTFRKTVALVNKLPDTWQRYDLVGRNCNHLVGRIARQIGLGDPGGYADLPENYVRSMRAANGGRTRASWR